MGAQQVVGEGRYAILSGLARGGFKTVWRAHDRTLDAEVALAVLNCDDGPESRAAFWKETQMIAGLTRDIPPRLLPFADRVVELTDYGELKDATPFSGFFIATRMVNGRTLRDMRDELPMDWRRAFRICAGILEALELSHTSTTSRGAIVHRDIKPSNVIVRDDDTITVIDFGVAKLLQSNETAVSQIVGTPQYMAPEQLEPGRQMGPAVDLFAVGVILHELLTGHQPWSRGSLPEILAFYQATTEGTAPPLKHLDAIELPRAVDVILRAALAVDPNARPASAIEMRDVLLANAGNEMIGTANTSGLSAPATRSAAYTTTIRENLADMTPTPAPPPESATAPSVPVQLPEPTTPISVTPRPASSMEPTRERVMPGWGLAALVGAGLAVVVGVGYASLRQDPLTLTGGTPDPVETVQTATTATTSAVLARAETPDAGVAKVPAVADAGPKQPTPDELLDAAERALLTDRPADADDLLTKCLAIDPEHEKCQQTFGILYARGYRRPVDIPLPPKGKAWRAPKEPRAGRDRAATWPPPRWKRPKKQATTRQRDWVRLRSKDVDVDVLQLSMARERDLAACVRDNRKEIEGRPSTIRVGLIVRHDGYPSKVRVRPEQWATSRTAICLEDIVMDWRLPKIDGPPRPAKFELEIMKRR